MKYTCQIKPPTGHFTVGRTYECERNGSAVTATDDYSIKVVIKDVIFDMSFVKTNANS